MLKQSPKSRKLRIESLEERQVLASVTVTSFADGPLAPNDGTITLREAIAYVNQQAQALADANDGRIAGVFGTDDTIIFNLPTVNVPDDDKHKITLASALPQIIARDLVIDGTNTNQGPTEPKVRLFRANTNFEVILNYNGAAPNLAGKFEVRDLKIDNGGINIQALSQNDEVVISAVEITNARGEAGINFDKVPFGPTGKFTITGSSISVSASTPLSAIKVNNDTLTAHSSVGASLISSNLIGSGNAGAIGLNLGYGADSVEITGNTIFGFGGNAAVAITGNAGNLSIHDNPLIRTVYNSAVTTPSHNPIRITAPAANVVEDRQISITNNVLSSQRGTGLPAPAGVFIHSIANDPAMGQAGYGIEVSGNDYSNLGMPLDLQGDSNLGTNDGNDISGYDQDAGPNNLLNRPEVTVALQGIVATEWRIPIDVSVDRAGQYRVEFYKQDPGLSTNFYSIDTGVRNALITVLPSEAGKKSRHYVYVSTSQIAVGSSYGVQITGHRDSSGAALASLNTDCTSELTMVAAQNNMEYLEGDFNNNGVVDSSDLTVWRNHFNTTVTDGTNGDADFDGDVDGTDYLLWQRYFGSTLANTVAFAFAATPLGDFNADKTVNAADYDIWTATIGSTTDLRADANYNGIVDASDFGIWQEYRGVTTASTISGDFDGSGIVDSGDYAIWAAGNDIRADADADGLLNDADDYAIWNANFGRVRFDLFPAIIAGGSGLPLEVPNAGPKVINVVVGNAGGATHSFASIAGTGEQLRTVPVANANKVSVRFNEEVFLLNPALTLTNLDGASPGAAASFSYNVPTQTATWTFASALADGRYVLRLADTVFDLDRDSLDGDFNGPWALSAPGVDALPSGNGVNGGEFRFRFTILSGDSDRNNIHGATNYQNWTSIEPGMIYVSTTADEYDGNLAFGDVSLREAVNWANTSGVAATVVLPTGRYTLSRTGAESTPTVAYNDLNIDGNVTISGDGPGFSIIDNSGLSSAPANNGRTFQVSGATKRLALSRLTIANSAASQSALVGVVSSGAILELDEVVVTNHTALAGGTAIHIASSTITINRSVFTNNDNTGTYGGAAIQVSGTTSAPASVTVGESIFAFNYQPGWAGPAYDTKNAILISSGAGTVTKINKGKNLYDFAGGGFFNTTPGVGDHLGTPTYIVTSAADTFNHADDLEALSLREAIDLANNATSPAEVWVPAWSFTLTRDRGTSSTDTDVSFGDLDVKKSMVVRGIADRTNVVWKSGVVDRVFDLLGDFDNDSATGNGDVDGSDYLTWQTQNGSVGSYGQFSADGDDDGDVDANDYAIWQQYYGKTLQRFNIGV